MEMDFISFLGHDLKLMFAYMGKLYFQMSHGCGQVHGTTLEMWLGMLLVTLDLTFLITNWTNPNAQ